MEEEVEMEKEEEGLSIPNLCFCCFCSARPGMKEKIARWKADKEVKNMDENVQENEKICIDLTLESSSDEEEDENISNLDSSVKLKIEKWKVTPKMNNMDENVNDNENVFIDLTLESSDEEEEAENIFIPNVYCHIYKASPGTKEKIAKWKADQKVDSMDENEQENEDVFIDLTLESSSDEEEVKNLCSCYLCRANNGVNEQIAKWKEDQNENNMEPNEEENEEIFIDLTLESSSDEDEKISNPNLYNLCSHGANNGIVKEPTEEAKEQDMNKDEKDDQEEDECFIDLTLESSSDEEQEQLPAPELCSYPPYGDFNDY
ncbi:glutamic acid-rich protein-like isoform X2 [Ornithorhynchus anatinus]|uniref:glutamic acid-rich protein-like isoform X2 n=1 Tax=Ornithorhynchus anatinus TaxID=9258 RepID=UPI0019D4934F|nr:glutamic acid-rich protein-like isoform X2 [Ornithorhynchus anatinus]